MKDICRKFIWMGAVLVLALSGCTGMAPVKGQSQDFQQQVDCGGDVPSPYPPYCHPRR
ncbi:hypothetical protein DSTSK_27690 [Desulforhabdus sp. TSK]|nr:hypothetical protein DSTSK_27690 [Desulforhabdus sp. TSK]